LILALVSLWLLVNSFKETFKEKRSIDFFYFIQRYFDYFIIFFKDILIILLYFFKDILIIFLLFQRYFDYFIIIFAFFI